MAPTKGKRTATKQPPPKLESDSDSDQQGQSPSQPQSQEIDAKKIEQLVKRQNEQTKAKKLQRQNDIETTRTKNLDKIQKKMANLERDHQAEIRKIQSPKITQLRNLIQQRREIEAQITTCWTHIDQLYENTIQQYEFAITGRLEDLG